MLNDFSFFIRRPRNEYLGLGDSSPQHASPSTDGVPSFLMSAVDLNRPQKMPHQATSPTNPTVSVNFWLIQSRDAVEFRMQVAYLGRSRRF